MAGNTANPRLWEGADLWTAPVGTQLPDNFDSAMDTVDGWEAVGLLSEDGASESRDEDSNDFFAWGGKLIRTTRSKHKRQITITALEDNLTVFNLVNPGSTAGTADGVTTRSVYVPRADRRAFCLELRDGDIIRRRWIRSGEVSEVGEVTLSDSELQAFELTITIYPDENGVLYLDLDNDANNQSDEPPSIDFNKVDDEEDENVFP